VRSILGGLIPQLAAATATSASVSRYIDPPFQTRNRKIHLPEIFLTLRSETIDAASIWLEASILLEYESRARARQTTVDGILPIMSNLGKVSTGNLLNHPLPGFTARKVYEISRLDHDIKVKSKLFALDCKSIDDQ
jgi:hypothetical protein